jgi:predicted acylesterase/phospholipase RssA
MIDRQRQRDDASIGVALSGGGHRATLLGLGALLYLTDAGKGANVHTIASVSAGSITNAYLASLPESPLAARQSFEPHVAHLVHKISGDRQWWVLSWTLVAVLSIWFAGMLFATPVDEDWPLRLAAPLIALVLVALFIGPRSGGSLWAWRGTWLWLVALTVSLIPGTFLWRTADGTWPRAFALAVSCVLFGIALFARGHALRWSLSRIIAPLGARGRNRAGLEAMNKQIEHVICATELHAGTHTYFGRDFIYTREFGFGEPAGMPMATALHASASFPLVFPVCILRARKHSFRFPDAERKPRRLLVLSDGGLVDNMADAWQLGAAERARRLSWLNRVQDDEKVVQFVGRLKSAPETLVVIDASPPPVSQGVGAALVPLLTELFGVARTTGVSYSNAVQTRARDLEARFANNAPRGALVASAKSPMDVIAAVLDPNNPDQPPADVIERATAARTYLAARFADEEFRAFPTMTMASGTYLTPVGAERAAHIVLHGYLQAMITLHITLGYPLLAQAPVREDFRRLAAGGVTTPQVRKLSAAAV